jgi:hypothetical protein
MVASIGYPEAKAILDLDHPLERSGRCIDPRHLLLPNPLVFHPGRNDILRRSTRFSVD